MASRDSELEFFGAPATGKDEELEFFRYGPTPKPAPVAPLPAAEPSGIFRRSAGDTAVSALKSAISVPEAAVGLADIPTGGAVGRKLEQYGFRPKEAKAALDELYSPEQRAINAGLAQTKGFLPTAEYMFRNPSTLYHTTVESAAPMLAGGAAARGALALAPKLSPVLAGAAGEGVVGAGLSAEQIRQATKSGYLTPEQSLAALASGVGTAGIGAVGGKIAQRYGLGDVETMLARGTREVGAKKGAIRRVAEGALSEGVIEELPQSAQEQMWQNIAMGRPTMEGVEEAAAQGLLTGGIMGGGMNLISRAPAPKALPTERVSTPSRDVTGMTPDMFTGEMGEGKDQYQAAMEDAIRSTQPTTAQAEMFEIPNPTIGYGGLAEGFKKPKPMTKKEVRAAEKAAAKTQAVAAPMNPTKRQDIIATLDDHLANERITPEQHDMLMSDATDSAVKLTKLRKNIETAIAENQKPAVTPETPGEVTVADAAGNVKVVPPKLAKVKAKREKIPTVDAAITIPIPEAPVDAAQIPEYEDSMRAFLAHEIDPVRMAVVEKVRGSEAVGDVSSTLSVLGKQLGVSKQAVHKQVRNTLGKLKARGAAAGLSWEDTQRILGIATPTAMEAGVSEGAQEAGAAVRTVMPESDEFVETAGMERTETATGEGAVDEGEAQTEAEISEEELLAAQRDLDEAERRMSMFTPEKTALAAAAFGDGFNELHTAEQIQFVTDVSNLVAKGVGADEFVAQVEKIKGERYAPTKKAGEPRVSEKAAGREEGVRGEPREVAGRGQAGEGVSEVTVGAGREKGVTVVSKKKRAIGPKMVIAEEGETSASVRAALNKAFFSNEKLDRMVTIVEEAKDLPPRWKSAVLAVDGAVGGFYDEETDHVYLIAKNITPGKELSFLLHEVGVHMGMKRLIGQKNYDSLITQLQTWQLDGTGFEGKLARKAYENVQKAEAKIGEKYDQTLFEEEFLAYFVGAAVENGVNPKAMKGQPAGLRAWFDTLMNSIKSALRKLGVNPEKLTAEDVVDLAYGAAQMEMEEGAKGGVSMKMSVAEPSPRSTVTYYSEFAMKNAEKALKKKGGYRTVSVAKTPEGTYEVTRVKTEKPGLKFSIAEATKEAATRVGGATAEKAITDTTHVLKKSIGWMTYLHDLVKKVEKGMPSARTWYEGLLDTQEARLAMERDAEKVAVMASKMGEKERTQVNKFISDSTVEQKWGFKPSWNKDAVVDAGMEAEWNRLSKDQKTLTEAVFKHGYDSNARKRKLFEKLGVSDVMSQFGTLTGPYAPLKRFGNFVAVLKSKELVDAEAALKEDDSEANRTKVIDLKRDPANYKVSSFHTPGQAEQFVKENRGAYAFADSFASTERLGMGEAMNYQVMQKVMSAVKADPSLPAQVRTEMENTIRALYLSSLDETNARQSGQKRKNYAGYDEDMIRSFLAGARADAAYVANLEHGGKTNDAFYKMQEEEVKSPSGHRVHQDDFNLLAQHYAENMKYEATPIQDRVVGLTSAWQLATSLGYHLANALQGVMVTLPRLAAEGSYAGAWKHLMDGYGVMKDITTGMAVDLSKIKNAGLRNALELAANRGILDVGIEEDLGQFDQFRSGYKKFDGASRYASMALHKLRSVSRFVETMNRVSSGVAAYNMALAKGKTAEQAQQYMVDVLATTQGDMSRIASPLLLKRIPKFMGQYRKFQLMMMAFYVKGFNQAFRGATPEERAIGRRMMAFKLMHTSVAAGVLGLPLMNLAAMAFGAGDDDPEDLESKLRGWIGNDDLADLLLHGASAITPLDMSAKLGEDKIFSIAPYTDFDFSSKEGVAKTVAGIVGGPAMGQVGRMADGIGLMKDGQWVKGIEKQLPKGVSDMMSAFRMANDGYTLKNGDVAVKPEDMDNFGLALTFVGLPASQIKDLNRTRGLQYEMKEHFKDRASEIQHEYGNAWRDKDSAKMRELRKEWMALQRQKAEMRKKYFNNNPKELQSSSMSSLIRYPMTVHKREVSAQKSTS